MTVSATTAIGGVSRMPSYYRARYYNPTTGRFLSEDPIGFAGSGTNLYAYAKNNPINFNDPTGLCVANNPLNNLSQCQLQALLAVTDTLLYGLLGLVVFAGIFGFLLYFGFLDAILGLVALMAEATFLAATSSTLVWTMLTALAEGFLAFIGPAAVTAILEYKGHLSECQE